MVIVEALRSIINHPLNRNNKFKAIVRFIRWQIGIRINPYPIIFPFGEQTKLIISKGMYGATGNVYCGLEDFSDMSFALHFLRKDDLFVDIGANVGTYTLLASGEVGAETVSIEPIPQTYSHLRANINLNELDSKVKTLNIGLSNKGGILKFTKGLDTVNHVATEKETDTIDVQIQRFDDIIDVQKTTLIKIDVEGFETEVLNGMDKVLSNPLLKAIIIELNGSGNRYGYDENKIHEKLISNNFKPYNYFPFERNLVMIESFGSFNTIYIKDEDFVLKRVKSARKINILDQEI